MQNFFKKYGYGILLGLIFLLGVLLRLKGLLSNPSLWHDECALAWNIKYRSYGDFFGILRFMQMAPPFFMILTKLTTKIFGISDITLRILPFLAGCLSIIAFYFLAQKTLKNKPVVLLAVFLFVINKRMINYSFEFKPYSFDVLFAIICLLFFMNLDWEKLNAKKAALYGILLSVVTWFSFTSVFVIAGGILNLFFKGLKNKKSLFTLYPLLFTLLISGLIYLKVYLLNNYMGTHMVNYWQDSFLSANPVMFLVLLINNIRYFFHPMPYVLFALILFVWGINIFYKEKSEFLKISVISFVLLVVASLLHIYPFSTRLILFLLPMFLLFMVKPFDLALCAKKTKLFGVLLLMVFVFYPRVMEMNQFIHTKNISRGEYPREMMDYMVKKLKPEDTIIVNSDSDTEFEYYSSLYNIKNEIFKEKFTGKSDAEYLKLLNSFPKGYYWFYLPYDYSHTPVIPIIISWAETKKILYRYQKDISVLMYVYIK